MSSDLSQITLEPSLEAADKELKVLRKTRNTLSNVQNNEVEWKYIPERGPHMGGFYERMVRSLKTPLRKVLNKALLNAEEFSTVLAEIEGQINSRPLTPVRSAMIQEMQIL